MKTLSRTLLMVSVFLFISGISFAQVQKSSGFSKRPKNIILFIGDGMGISHVTAAMTASDQPFNLKQFPYSGFSITQSADDYITDSGAGGTAIACGVKTNNGMIGMAPDNTVASSITEIAHKNGLATGVVSTSAITHATPASFSAHNINRDNYEEIAGLLAKLHMAPVIQGRGGMLEEMTRKAIETLSRDKDGFFLMVEGSMIDWGSHENNLFYAVNEVIDMDKAVGVALEFADKNRKTLVVVTADHETGGLSLTGGNKAEHVVSGNFAVTDHTGVMVPVFSYGPGAQDFSGNDENTFFHDTFLNLLKISK